MDLNSGTVDLDTSARVKDFDHGAKDPSLGTEVLGLTSMDSRSSAGVPSLASINPIMGKDVPGLTLIDSGSRVRDPGTSTRV